MKRLLSAVLTISALGQTLIGSPVVNANVSDIPTYLTIEAESMTLTSYIVNSNSVASGGNLIKLSSSSVTGNATYTFAGATDTYDIRIWYFDEEDGTCTFNVYVAGVKVDTWIANQALGSIDPVAQTRTSQTISGVSIANGEQIKLEAVQNNQEWGRYDNIEIYTHGYQPPSVSITSPSNNAVFTAGATITINANASSLGGSITKVEFYRGTTKFGESTASPYSYTWSNVPAGGYTLTAKATDNIGVTQTSSGVNIIVLNSEGGIVINFTTPSDGTTLQNVVAVNVKAYDTRFGTNDGAGIREVLFYLLQGSMVVASHQELAATYDWSLDVAGLTNGDYVLQAKAFGTTGDSSVSQINVHVIANPRPSSDWVLTFSDEFNGTGAPDPTKWDRPEYNRRNNSSGPDGWWEQDDSYMENGNLVIRIRKVEDRNGDGDPYDYSVGAIRTLGHFTQTYGKYEIRAQLPMQQGWWIAFWMMQGNQGRIGNGGVDGSEVDIMEAWGWTNKINHAIHWDGCGSSHKSVGTSAYPPGIQNGFHTYSLIWDPDMYYFYIDSVEVWRTTGGGVCNQPGYIKITGECSTESWAILDSWSRDPTDATYPDYFLVDWVRVYQSQTGDVEKTPAGLPVEFVLDQNYPNPFNLETNIQYQLPKASKIQLEIYDIRGCKVRVLVKGEQPAGFHIVRWNGLNELGKPVSSGIYFYRMKATSANRMFTQNKRMLLLK